MCTSCHTSHNILDHTDPRSSIHRDNVAETCQACHTQIEQVHVQVIEGRLWEEEPHKVPACVDCHAPHQQRRVFYDPGAANEDCLSCHRDPSLTGYSHVAGDTVSLYVDEHAYALSDHNYVVSLNRERTSRRKTDSGPDKRIPGIPISQPNTKADTKI